MKYKIRLPPRDFERFCNSTGPVPGPTISTASAYHYLRNEPWIEFGDMSLRQCKSDGVVPWFRQEIPNDSDVGQGFMAGPNTVFFDSSNRAQSREVINNPYIIGLSVLNGSDLQGVRQLTDARFRGQAFRVRHFLRPTVYDKSFFAGRQSRKLLIYIKGNINPALIAKYYTSSLILYYGFYSHEVLLRAAETCCVCLYVSHWESFGNAAQEIIACGCPVIAVESGVQRGNALEGRMVRYIGERGFRGTDNEIKANGIVPIGGDLDEVDEAIEECCSWDRQTVYEASREFNDPRLILQLYRDAFSRAIDEWQY
jgi:hypothetical protein